ncbi:hypothetical protein [uncultured Tateyamaria sp.]|uniref:hypothetical protein n=1 Tax=uncultured Tateyamaria sp. TaxID=455651 RepID=UPI0026148CF9|nr:hypothetical protein [uncultured Tateyamaria sp.]
MVSKATVEAHHQLCIFTMRRSGVLHDGYTTNWVWRNAQTLEETGRMAMRVSASAVHLSYRLRWGMGDWESISDTIFLSITQPEKGGVRWWFECPGCHARRAKLYLSTYFRCRSCLGLCYSSQLEHTRDRDLRRFFKRRQSLGVFGGICEPFPAKPKWMRWATYHQLHAQDCRDITRIDAHTIKLLERVGEIY